MNIYSFFSAAAFAVYLILSAHAFRKPGRCTPPMVVFAVFCLLHAIWSSIYAFVSSAHTMEEAWRLINVFAFSRTLPAASFLHFALLFTGTINFRQWFVQLLLYIPGLIFTVKGTTGPLLFDKLVLSAGAWVEVTTGPSLWAASYAIYYHLFMLAGIVLIGTKYRRSGAFQSKRQAGIIIAGYAVSTVLIIFNTYVQPAVGIEVPRITHLFTLLLTACLWYSANRYGLFDDRRTTPTNPLWSLFSKREHEIIVLLMRGHSYREIGEQLYISYHTVKSHVERVYAKAKAKNKAQLLYKLSDNTNGAIEQEIITQK